MSVNWVIYPQEVEEMKGRKLAILIAVMLSLSIPSAFSNSDSFTVEYHFGSLGITDCGQWIDGTILQEIPGEPLIPYYPATILLPQDATVKDVKVKTGPPTVFKGFDLPWGQPPCTFSDNPVKVGRNEEIYSSDNDYPSKFLDVTSVGSFRGFQILDVHLYPVQYNPKSQTVKFYESMTVEVKFGKDMKNSLYRGLPGDRLDVASMVDNPEMAAEYSIEAIPLAVEEYIIITTDTMQSVFQQLADWKADFVNGSTVYTVSWIYSNYTGRDNAEKVRNFIKAKYTSNGTKYILLGGDIAAVPYRGFYVYSGGYTDTDMLADMYFGHLDGTWNTDNDSYWAEPGEEDWYAEVAVGRASCENTTEAQNFVNKVMAYEQADKPKRALLHQSRVLSGNSPDSRCLAWNCDNWLPSDYYKHYLFEESSTVSKTAWINAWAQNPAVVAHIGHGSATSYYINYELGGLVTWTTSDVSSMTNTFWPWTTSVACISGQIEYNDCLAEVYVKDSNNGAIAAIYNDNYGWFSTLDACKYSGEFCEKEFRACWSDGKEKLGDMLNKARSYLVSSAQTSSTYRWCFYERNLVGDPESPSLTVRSNDCGKKVGAGWNFTHYFVGNWTNDGTDDLIVRKSNGEMWLYPFRDNTFYVPGYGKKVADNWDYTHYFPGNWTGNGTDDFIVRDSSGNLWLYQFTNETFSAPVKVGNGWNFENYFVGNWTNDGTDDLIVRKSNGEMWLYPFRNNTFYVPGYGKKVGENFNYTDYLVGYWTGDLTDDLVCRDANGYMWLRQFNNETFSSAVQVGHGFNFTHYFVGYWTGDGTDDLIVRDSNGNLKLYPFRNNSFYYIPGSGTVVASGFNFTDYFVGYWTGDGTDDFICRDSDANMWLYPFRDNDISCA
jgi:hypothetical protein